MPASIREWLSPTPTSDWVARMILGESVDHPTPTEEYVVRHNVALQRKEGRARAGGRGELVLREELVDRHRSERAVGRALEDLERRGWIARVDPPTDSTRTEREWWQLTVEGQTERDRLRETYERKLEELRFEYGVTERW